MQFSTIMQQATEQPTLRFADAMFNLVLVLATLTDLHFVRGDEEFHSDVTQLEGLLATEEQLVNFLHQYISSEEKRLKHVYEYAEYLRMHNSNAKANTDKYIANPISEFLLIKRLADDWKNIQSLLMVKSPEEFFNTLRTSSITLPSDKDMSGAIGALTRLQETYNLNTTLTASGKLNGVKYSSEMTANDCFTIGMYLHNNEQQFTLALDWLEEAERRHSFEEIPTIYKTSILEYQASCHFYKNNKAVAIAIIQELLKHDPQNQRLLETVNHYTTSELKVLEATKEQSYYKTISMDDYNTLCRGEFQQPANITSKLNCFYYKPLKNQFLQLAPFKVEEVFESPKMLIFYDILSDNEMYILQYLAKPKLYRAQIENNDKNDKPPKYSIGKLASITNDEHPLIATVSKRIEDMTGLTMTSSESLQVLNYEIGGQYEPHFDYIKVDKTKGDAFVENRIATVLMYMNDVEQGGATVFPLLGVRIPAKKGTAAFWYNLHSDLELDNRTLHGSCPVLVGEKWISNTWFRDINQPFYKPCDLKRPGEH